MTGFNLPPGVTTAMIDRAYGEETPCNICGQSVDDCICPECPVCGSQGDPQCYREHGLDRSLPQMVLRAYAEAQWEDDNRIDNLAAEEYQRLIRDIEMMR